MKKQPDLVALLHEQLGPDAIPPGFTIRSESPGMLRVSELAALAHARAMMEIAGGNPVPRAWLAGFVRRTLPILKQGYENTGQDPESIWANPYAEALAIVAVLDGEPEEGEEGEKADD